MNMKMIKVLSFLVFEIVTCVLSVKADYVPSMRSMAPISITALASATGNGTDSDEKFCEYTVTGKGILFIDYSIEMRGDTEVEGDVTCWIDGIEVFNFGYISDFDEVDWRNSTKGTLQWPLLSDGEHTIKWKVSAIVCSPIEPRGYEDGTVECFCSLDILNTSLKSWADMGLVTKTDNGFTLQLTNDIAHTMYFTDDLGEVVLDLNGHSIIGSKSLPGIAVVKGGGAGTHLKIVDLAHTGLSKVNGGDCDDKAGAGVEVLNDAAGVLISIGENVLIKGGDVPTWFGKSVVAGGVGVIGNIDRNEGTIIGGTGCFRRIGGGGSGSEGGIGVMGDVNENAGTIKGGRGREGVSPGDVYTDDYLGRLHGDGGKGGIGVKGYVQKNSGTIAGGKGGDSDFCLTSGTSAGDGGIGVLGNVGVNKGKILGGEGGQGVDFKFRGGVGGYGVKGLVSYNTSGAFIIGGEGGWWSGESVWRGGEAGGMALDGNVITNNGTIANGMDGCASVRVTCIDCVYDGSVHSIEIEILNLPEWFTLSGVKIGDDDVTPIDLGDGNYKVSKTYIDAGSYSPVRIVGEDGNITDNEECDGMVIQPKSISLASIGTISDCVYANCAFTPKPSVTDVERGVTLVEGQDYTLSYSNNKNAGVATVRVTGKGNYSGTVTRNFTIAKAEVVPPILAVKPYTGSAQTATVPSSPLYRVVQNIPQTAPGTYSVMLELTDGANYCWPDSDSTLYSVPFTIKSNEETELEDAFEDLPAEITPDNKGGWIVTLTNDITGPVEIPADLGSVTIDLNGKDIVGADGESAIRIVVKEDDPESEEDNGIPTHLSLVTTGGSSCAQGGVGASAIVVEDGAIGVVIDIGRGVTVRAGNDDVPAVSGGTIGEVEGELVKVQVEVPVMPNLEYTGSAQVPTLPNTAIYTVVASSGTNPGSYPVMLTLVSPDNYEWLPREGVSIVGAVASCTFTILDPPPRIETEEGSSTGEANGASVAAVYDGCGHGISVKVLNPPVGATVRYSTVQSGPFLAEKPLYTNAVIAAETWYEVSAEGYDPITNMATVTISPKPLTQTMIASKRLREADDGIISVQLTLSDVSPCSITQNDWELKSWEPRASGGGVATVQGKGNYSGTLTVDVPNEMTVVFDAVYGSDTDGEVRTVTTQIPGKPYALPPTAPVYRGHDFLGWFTERDGGEAVTSGRVVSLRDPDIVYAHWQVKRYHVSFNLNGGMGKAEDYDAAYGSTYPRLPTPEKPGYLFDGWWTSSDFKRGTQVSIGDPSPTEDTVLYAKWLRRALWYTDAMFHVESDVEYDGYLVDTNANDVVVGTIKVKVSKPNRKTGYSKLGITIQKAGEKKVTIKGETFDGSLSVTTKKGEKLTIQLGESALVGSFDRYAIDGARNIFTAKDADSKLRAAQALKQWQGAYALAWNDKDGWNGLTLSVGIKGKTKVMGVLVDGTKLSVNTQLLVGERECAVGVSWTKRSKSVAFLVWFKEDGKVECSNLPNDAIGLISNIKSSTLVNGAEFDIEGNIKELIPTAIEEIKGYDKVLPNGETVSVSGKKWVVAGGAKAAKIAYKKGELTITEGKKGQGVANASSLKLTYKSKDGSFTGSFTVYAIEKGKLKKHKATVTGVLIDGIGYGTATIKKVGTWAIEIK